MPWNCPECGKEFRNTNQWHSCARVGVDDHFRNRPAARAVFDKLMSELNEIGAFTLDPVKTAIQVRTTSTFLSIKPKKHHLDIEFSLPRVVDEFPIYKSFQISKNRVLHMAIIEEPADVDGPTATK